MKAVPSDFKKNCLLQQGIVAPFQRTIAICDANPILSDGIRQIFQDDPYLSRFSMLADATLDLAALKALAPDILIIDPSQRAESRETVSKAFLDLSGATSLIGYCLETSSVQARALSHLGFRGIMPKTVGSEELVRIVCAVAFGGVYLHESYTNNQVTSVTHPAPDADTLSDREVEVLRQVAFGGSMKEIAALLKISIKTVDTYKNRANSKLGLRSRSDIVRYAIQSGWMH